MGGAAIVGGLGLVGGLLGSSAASSAASAQAQGVSDASYYAYLGQSEATEEQRRQYDLSRQDLAPWREAGTQALADVTSLISAGPGEFTEDPGYQFRLEEGTKTLERGAAAKGGQLGGAQQKALLKYGQDYASNEYTNFLNRYYQKMNPYFTLAGLGQNATTTGVQAGQETASNISTIAQQYGSTMSNLALQSGQDRASMYINQANALTGGIGTGVNNYLAWQGTQ